MDCSFSSLRFSEPLELVAYAHSTNDHAELEFLYSLTSKELDSKWRLPQAFILWRLDNPRRLYDYLISLPTSLHSDSDYWLLLGLALRMLSHPDIDVINAYKRGLLINPLQADIHFNLANVLSDSDPYSAVIHYSKSLSVNPFQPNVLHNLGIIYNNYDYFHQAIPLLKSSLLLDPSSADAWCNLGLSYMGIDAFLTAEKCFIQAVSLDKSHPESLSNLSSLLISDRRLHQAIEFLESSPQCASGSGSSHALFNLGICHLILGRFRSGWVFYEERLNTHFLPPECHPSSGPILPSLELAPRVGQDNTPLLVWAEQGAGDTIQFIRYLKLLQSLDIEFEFHCPSSLVSLIRDWFDDTIVVKVLNEQQHIPSTNALHCPLLSLPKLFGTEIDSIPSTLPYLINSSPIPSHLTVTPPPGGISVGLVWASHSNNIPIYKKKSIALNLLMPTLLQLSTLGLINIHALQVGPDQKQLEPWLENEGVIDWSPFLHNYSDTAFITSQLDLIISVDTSVAHLSAAQNRPTWILLPKDADFRWLLSRTDSPWYPGSVRLFRQSSSFDWDSPIKHLCECLNDLFMLDLGKLSSSQSKHPSPSSLP